MAEDSGRVTPETVNNNRVKNGMGDDERWGGGSEVK
jgi:hypothetical protein